MKVGIELRIDVTKIDKARLYKGEKGTYLTMTAFVDLDQVDQYDNNGMITHKKEKDEQGNTPILGNTKVFWTDGAQAPQQQAAPQQYQQQAPQQVPQQAPQQSPMANLPKADDFSDDIPF
jgi:hypothetical protein